MPAQFVDLGYFDLVANVKECDQVSDMLDRGTELHVLGFGQPHHLCTSIVSHFMRRFEEVADNIKGVLPEMLREAGLTQVELTQHFPTTFGPLTLYRARRSV